MTAQTAAADIPALLETRRGILLDIGCGTSKQPGFVGMDRQPLPGVDIVHNWNRIPWPLDPESVLTIVASHVVEHVSPIDGHFIDWMNECWRLLKPHGQLALVTPYAGSPGYWQDPTHCNGCTEATFWYFDPAHPADFHRFYQPQPWKVEICTFHHNGNLEVVLRKRADDD